LNGYYSVTVSSIDGGWLTILTAGIQGVAAAWPAKRKAISIQRNLNEMTA